MDNSFKISNTFGEVEIYPKLALIEVKDFMGEIHHNLHIRPYRYHKLP